VSGDVFTAVLDASADIKPYTMYRVRVSARNSAGSVTSNWTESYVAPNNTRVPLMTLEAVPVVAVALACGQVEPTKVSCDWTNSFVLNSALVRYRLRVSGTDVVFDTTATKTTISDLLPGRTYSFEVQAFAGSGTVSSSVTVFLVVPTTASTSTAAPEALGAGEQNSISSGGIIGVAIAVVIFVILVALFLARRTVRVESKPVSPAAKTGPSLPFWDMEEAAIESHPVGHRELLQPKAMPQPRKRQDDSDTWSVSTLAQAVEKIELATEAWPAPESLEADQSQEIRVAGRFMPRGDMFLPNSEEAAYITETNLDAPDGYQGSHDPAGYLEVLLDDIETGALSEDPLADLLHDGGHGSREHNDEVVAEEPFEESAPRLSSTPVRHREAEADAVVTVSQRRQQRNEAVEEEAQHQRNPVEPKRTRRQKVR
jgi:hypothetical protein